MTAHANSLTARVKDRNAASGSAMTLPAHDLRVFLDGLGRLRYNVDALLAAAGLQRADLENPDARIPCGAYGAVLARAQQERFTPNLALELARVTPIGAWPLIDYIVVTADTVEAGVRQLARYMRITGAPFSIDVRDDIEPIRVEMTTRTSPFAIEFDAALMVLHFRNETDGPFAAALSFQHALDDAAEFARILGCPVNPNATWSGISVPLQTWRLPLRRRDPVLRQLLEGHANELLARVPSRTGLALEVLRALAPRVAGGDTRIESIGREFGMSARTLQRRLAGEGVSYQKLLDDERKAAAGRFVAESTLAIGEIAYLLGYSEAAAFHRAFKRWYGRTPERFRESGDHGDPPRRD
jgi:AraC-like DNA-binding protein